MLLLLGCMCHFSDSLRLTLFVSCELKVSLELKHEIFRAKIAMDHFLNECMNLKIDFYFFDSVYLLTFLQLGFQYCALWSGLKA